MTLASNSNNQLVLSAAYTYHVKFTTNGDRFIGHISDGPGASTVDHFEAAVVQGKSVYYVPMYLYGQSPANVSDTAKADERVYAGIADSATHITGTWIDMRGSFGQNDHGDGGQAQITADRTIIRPINSGWFTMENTPCSKSSPSQ